MPSDRPLPRAWLTVAVLWVTAALNYIDRLMIITMRDSVKETIPMTDAQFGLLTAVFLLVYAVLSPFAGFFADRFKRSRVILISLFSWSVVTWLSAYATTYEHLLLTRVLIGISQAACMPASAALIVEYHRGSTRSLASGLLLSGAMCGAALAGLGGWIAEHHGWKQAFSLFGLIGIGCAAGFIFLLRDPPEEAAVSSAAAVEPPVQFRAALATLFTNGSYLIMVVFACLLGVVSWSVVGWMPAYMKEHFQLSQGMAGLSTTMYINLAALLGMLIGGAWADRWSRTDERGRVMVPIIGLCMAGPAIMLIANTDLLPLALVGLMLYGLTRHFSDANMMPIFCLIMDPRYRATSWGTLTFFSSGVGGLGIYAGGVLRDANVDISRVFQFAAINVLLCAVLLLWIRSRLPSVGRRSA